MEWNNRALKVMNENERELRGFTVNFNEKGNSFSLLSIDHFDSM
jgi:hypothetical protein